MIYIHPLFSSPIKFLTGTLTFSKISKDTLSIPYGTIVLILNPGVFLSIRSIDKPFAPFFPVRTAVVK